jgi:hypothetical protein
MVPSVEGDRVANMRAGAFWTLRKQLEAGRLALPRDERMAEELCALRYKLLPTGKVAIEAKEVLKGRIGRSCDRADALAIAVWYDAGRPRSYMQPGFLDAYAGRLGAGL